jgi:hypothetical protein
MACRQSGKQGNAQVKDLAQEEGRSHFGSASEELSLESLWFVDAVLVRIGVHRRPEGAVERHVCGVNARADHGIVDGADRRVGAVSRIVAVIGAGADNIAVDDEA